MTSQVYNDFNRLLSVKRNGTESYQSFEATFAAPVAKFSAHGKDLAIH